MQLLSLHLLPRTWLTACKLAAAQQAEGKTRFLLDRHIHPHRCSHLRTTMLRFLNSLLSKPSSVTKRAFCPIRRRTPSPAKSRVVWQREKDHSCRLCAWCALAPLVSGFQGATVVQSQKRKERKERNQIFTGGKVIPPHMVQI